MKKVIKGWVSSYPNTSDVLYWEERLAGCVELEVGAVISRSKGKKCDWGDDWPPRRVTITVEVEDA